MSIFWLGVIFFTLRIIYGWLTSKPKNYPPGPRVKAFIGNFPRHEGKHMHLIMEELKADYGRVVGLQAAGHYFVMVAGGKEALEAMKKEEFLGRPQDINNQAPRPGIMFTDGDHWAEQRKFTMRHLREFGLNKKGMETLIHREVEELFQKRLGDKNRHNIGDLFVVSSINVLWAIIGGDRFSYDDPELKKLVDVLNLYFHSETKTGFLVKLKIVQKLFPKWAGVYEKELVDSAMNEFFTKVIKQHRQTMTDKPRDFIDLYLKELQNPDVKFSFAEETLMAVCMDLFSGGVQSVHYSMGFCMLYSVLYPEWQEKIYEEIISVVGKERRPNIDDRKSLPNTLAFMDEVTRCNPISPVTVPRRAEVDTTFQGYNIPKNTMIFISQYAVLNDKEHWGDPKNFRPERFLTESGDYKKDDWLVVFGGGKRICVGETFSELSLYLLFTALIQEYKIELPEGHPKPSTFPVPGFTASPQPFEVILTKRD